MSVKLWLFSWVITKLILADFAQFLGGSTEGHDFGVIYSATDVILPTLYYKITFLVAYALRIEIFSCLTDPFIILEYISSSPVGLRNLKSKWSMLYTPDFP